MTDLVHNLRLCIQFTEGLDLGQFQAQVETQYAVIRALEIVGEATKRLPESFRAEHADIPWKSMAGMRDRLIHGYDDINLELVFLTASQTLSPILSRIEQLLLS